MIRVADYIFKTLVEKHHVESVFMVTGGGAMHLNDALGREKRIRYICNHHEQACAMAAEGYARVTNKPGVVLVTSGPGGGNAVTGVMGAWLDSIPMVVLSGQVKCETTISRAPGLRQLGDQEINIVDIVRPITKYCHMVTNSQDIQYHLERAIYLATHGRPGPVWLDIPLDIQAAQVDEAAMRLYDPLIDLVEMSSEALTEVVDIVMERLAKARRPVIVAGNGITLSNSRDDFRALVDRLGIPILTAISGIDTLPSDSPWFFGRPGILGERCANFVLQNSDFVLILGTRMGIRMLGYNYPAFAREAYKVMVDIDEKELTKPTLNLDLPVQADVGVFIRLFDSQFEGSLDVDEWLDYCRRLKKQYPVVLEEYYKQQNCVSSYVFADVLSDCLTGDEIIVTANGTIYTSTFQVIRLKGGHRMFANVGCASMGYGLPAAIGASIASPGRKVLCLTGDGSIQMNLQEFQTVLGYNLPLKILMFNNQGYVSIKNTQTAFFDGYLVGSSPESGVTFPDMRKIALAYGFKVYEINNHDELWEELPSILKEPGAVFCEIKTHPLEVLGPKSASRTLADGSMDSRPLEDLAPLLPRSEFRENMIIPPLYDDSEFVQSSNISYNMDDMIKKY